MTPTKNHPFKIRDYFLNFLFPPFCAGCQVYLGLKANARELCTQCRQALERSIEIHPHQQRGPAPIDLRWSMASYRDEPLATLIHKIKYQRKNWIMETIEPFIEESASVVNWGAMADMIIPVPLHPRRQRARGFNQAALIARALARPYGLKIAENVLMRIKPTKPQKDIKDPAARKANIQNAFKALPEVEDQRILLVDDVSTTGATLKECALALEAQGAKRIHAFTLAH